MDTSYGEDPKAVWEVPRLSADTLSDIKGWSHADDDNNNDSEIETIEQPTATPTTAAAAKVEKGLTSDPRVVKPSTWDCSILAALNIFFFMIFKIFFNKGAQFQLTGNFPSCK
jgi:hypothetical protein